MRIAVIHSFYTARQPSGENNVVLDQVEQLRSSGHDVRLIARHTDDLSVGRWYPVRAAVTTITGQGASPEVALEEFHPDVVHVHNTFPNWGTAWLRRWGNRSVVTAHNFRPMCAAGTLFRDGRSCTDCLSMPVLPGVVHGCYRGSPLASAPVAWAGGPAGSLRRVVQRAARVVTLNEQARTVFTDVFHRHVDLVPNFVQPSDRVDANRGWVYVGRLSSEKGIDKLVEMWPPEEPLDVIGHGPLQSKLAAKASSKPNIRLHGLLPREELLKSLGLYRAVVLPSMCAEGLPTIILEALARGVPSILSGHVAASTFLAGAGAAVVFDPTGGEGAVKAALDSVAASGTNMRQVCTELHHREYAPHVWQERMDDIYEDVATSASSS